MPAGLMASAPPTRIPPTADLARMHRERVDRIRAVMREQGLDALVLLGNTNVVYATGAIWPLADSGRANFEQPVALVLADDEWPHLFSPMREDDRLRAELPSDHIHGPVYLDFDEGVQLFASQLARLVPDNAVIAIDEWTNALRRERSILFAPDAPVDGGRVISTAKAIKTPDELSCMREGLRITERAIAEVQARLAPGVRQTDLTGDLSAHDLRRRCGRQHPRPDLAGDACSGSRTGRGRRPATSPARSSRPNASSPKAMSCGSTPASAMRGSTPTSDAPGSSDASRMPGSARSSSGGGRSWTPSSTSPAPERPPRT